MSTYWWILICPAIALIILSPLCALDIGGFWPYHR